jgi:2-polyprenyl-3-methyl-5-hydroxy-6-metoxy-1,4-benzoquinol methylase
MLGCKKSLDVSHQGAKLQSIRLQQFPLDFLSVSPTFHFADSSTIIKMSHSNPPSHSTGKNPSIVRYLDTASAYDLWSEVYDTDGNFLQALDTIEMKTLLPKFLQQIRSSKPWKMVDLGCGTGRNTLSLLHVPGANVIGLELSQKMLGMAQLRIDKELSQMNEAARAGSVDLEIFDIIQQTHPPTCAIDADAIISTLVLEHIPANTFFNAVSQMLKPDGVLLVTNMHSDMGKISQAGFVDPKTGEKIRPTSYAHRIDDVIAGARLRGFELEGDVLEKGVDEASSDVLGERAKKWAGILVWYGMIFRKNRNGPSDRDEANAV